MFLRKRLLIILLLLLPLQVPTIIWTNLDSFYLKIPFVSFGCILPNGSVEKIWKFSFCIYINEYQKLFGEDSRLFAKVTSLFSKVLRILREKYFFPTKMSQMSFRTTLLTSIQEKNPGTIFFLRLPYVKKTIISAKRGVWLFNKIQNTHSTFKQRNKINFLHAAILSILYQISYCI